MTCLCILLFLFSVSTCAHSQITMTVTGGGVLKPTTSMELTCAVSGGSITDSSKIWSVNWIRDLPGRGLEWIGRCRYSGDLYYNPSLQRRSTVSRDTSKNMVHLQIREVKAEDTGNYYCAKEYRNYFDIWGSGTFVAVTSVPITKPQVFILANCCSTSSAGDQFGILATGYMPGDLSYNWKNASSSITSGISTTPSILSTTSGLYLSSSVIAASRSDLETSSVSCTVEHPTSSTTVTKNVEVNALCKPRPPPEAKLMQTSCPERDSSGFVGVVCIGSSLSSSDFTVIFREDSKEVSLTYNRSPVSQATDGTYMVNVYTRMSEAKWNTGVILTCTITDTKTKKTASASLSRCVDDYNVLNINVILLAPTAWDLYTNKKPNIKCTAINLPDAGGATFTWIREKVNGTVTPVNQDPEQHQNGIYSQTSLLPICFSDWEDGETFTCRVSHPKLTNPIQKTIAKDLSINPISPSVYVYGPTPEEVSRNEMVSVACIAKSFLPQDISIKWTLDGTEVDSAAYDTTPPQLMKATKDFVCVSVLQVAAEAWKSDAKLTCIVAHEGAAHNIIQQSIDKYSGKPSTLTMSIHMLDSSSTLTCM